MAAGMGRRGVVWKTPTVTADGLKLFAAVMMLISNIGIAIVQNGIIHLEQYTQASLSDALANDPKLMTVAGVGVIMQMMEGLAVVLFAFLLVEGFRNTSNFKKYLLTMIVFAIVSEIPYDLAICGALLDPSSQNALATMAVCLVMLYFLDLLKEGNGFLPGILRILIVLCALFWVTMFRMAYGLGMVLLVADLYLLYNRNVLKTLLGVVIGLLYITGPLAFYGIWCCNGERKDRIPKYAYYIFYPAHLLVLGIIARFL